MEFMSRKVHIKYKRIYPSPTLIYTGMVLAVLTLQPKHLRFPLVKQENNNNCSFRTKCQNENGIKRSIPQFSACASSVMCSRTGYGCHYFYRLYLGWQLLFPS